MTWITENPWPLMIILAIAAIAFLAAWTSQKRRVWLAAGILSFAAVIAVYLFSKSIVTEAERVAQAVHDLAAAFQRKDKAGTLSFFSIQAPELRTQVEQGLNWVEMPDGIDIKDVHVSTSNENTRAVSHFRANGTASVRGMGSHHIASRWAVTWQKEGADWKIIEVQRLHPLKDEKMDMFDQRGN
jgi:ketosteroid isomerase-like protein